MTENTLEQQMLALLKAARKAAYEKGWKDAVHTIMAAATNAAPDADAREAAWTLRQDASPNTPDTPTAVDRAPWGLTIRAAEVALDRAGDRGIDIDTVRVTARELEGHDLAESSIRTTLLKMERQEKISKRGNRWYPVLSAKAETAEPAHQASSVDPLFHNQGGPNGAALANPLEASGWRGRS